MSKRYWQEEEPVVVDTGENILRLYENAQKLQISLPYWTSKDGVKTNGKTVTLNIEAVLKSPEAIVLFRGILG
jgi:hypothetical protein